MSQPKITVVELDALALVSIVKHCSESAPDIVTGQLLGLDMNGTLSITRSFPFASYVLQHCLWHALCTVCYECV